MKKFMIIAATATFIFIFTLAAFGKDYKGDVYSAYTPAGVRLAMCDNGTPDKIEDDFVIDWEDNRSITVTVHD